MNPTPDHKLRNSPKIIPISSILHTRKYYLFSGFDSCLTLFNHLNYRKWLYKHWI